MKIKITEDQKNNLFKPHNLEGRDKQYFEQIGMIPFIELLKDNETIEFLLTTPPDEYDWYMEYVWLNSEDSRELDNMIPVIKKFILERVVNESSKSYHVVEGCMFIERTTKHLYVYIDRQWCCMTESPPYSPPVGGALNNIPKIM